MFNNLSENLKEEWIWVEGYKATDKNMKCQGFQYELGKHYVFDGEVKLCEKGYHFCKELKDVFNFYPLIGSRFFKVKGLVSKYELSPNVYVYDPKMVAKEIIFLEELTYDDLKEYIKEYYPFIESEEEYKNCNNASDYESLAKNKFIKEMSKLGFSELYSMIQVDKFKHGRMLYNFLQHARAYVSENISKDLMVYLLESKFTQ